MYNYFKVVEQGFSMKNKINVCISCDNNYAKHAAVVMASALANAKEEDNLAFYILDGGITQESKEKMEQLKSVKDCEINFVTIDDELFEDYKKVKTHSYISLPTFYRLKLPTLLPNLDKIIYFDCDFAICTSLEELFNVEIGKNIIAGVHDTDEKKVKENPTYINAGMIVFDLKRMREENTEAAFLKWTQENIQTIKLGDQEIINEVLKGQIEIIDPTWNVQSSNFINRSNYTRHPKAIHLLAKPWKFARACYHKKVYFDYLQLTPWKLNEKEYKHWTTHNQILSIFRYFRKRPFFWLRPNFYVAFYYTYIKKED